MVVDVAGINLLDVEGGSAFWASLGREYRENMAVAGKTVPKVEVVPVKLPELGMVELDGPWNAVCWLGAQTVIMGLGIKWGFFQSDADARRHAFSEALCIAKVFRATKLLAFPSGEFGLDAYAAALEGASLPALVEKLDGVASPIKLSIHEFKNSGDLSATITNFSDELDRGFIIVEL